MLGTMPFHLFKIACHGIGTAFSKGHKGPAAVCVILDSLDQAGLLQQLDPAQRSGGWNP